MQLPKEVAYMLKKVNLSMWKKRARLVCFVRNLSAYLVPNPLIK